MNTDSEVKGGMVFISSCLSRGLGGSVGIRADCTRSNAFALRWVFVMDICRSWGGKRVRVD